LTALLVERASEYGQASLDVTAAGIGALIDPPAHLTTDFERRVYLLEAAIAFHALSKVGRLFAAYKRGQIPSNDTWDDLTAYPAMATKIRSTGLWVVE
jgi:hypothetical protein